MGSEGYEVLVRGLYDPQNYIQSTVTALGYLPEINGKAMVLKILHCFGCKTRNPAETKLKASSSLLVLIVQGSGEADSYTLCYSSNLPGKRWPWYNNGMTAMRVTNNFLIGFEHSTKGNSHLVL